MQRTLRLACGTVTAAILCLAPPAFAERKQERIHQYNAKAEEFSARDTHKVVTADIGLLKSFLAEAQNYLAQEEEEDLELALDRIKAAAEFIEAEIARADAEDTAMKAQQRTEAKEAELNKIESEISRLTKERETIEAGGR